MRTNTFFSSVVRIQTERGHHVVIDGPYAYLRHPGYVSMGTMGVATALLLGSWWALIPSVVQALLMVVRTALEGQTLQAELPAYRDYASRERYRLLRGVW